MKMRVNVLTALSCHHFFLLLSRNGYFYDAIDAGPRIQSDKQCNYSRGYMPDLVGSIHGR
jgi:hypothetical protein